MSSTFVVVVCFGDNPRSSVVVVVVVVMEKFSPLLLMLLLLLLLMSMSMSMLLLLLLLLVLVVPIIMVRKTSPERRMLAAKKPDPTATNVNNSDRSNSNELLLPNQSSPSLSASLSASLSLKCRLLVIRNVFTKETIDKVLPKYIQYINDIDEGRINSKGTTSFGGGYFILKEDNYRYNYMLTKELIEKSSNILANEIIIDILSHPKILGEQMILNHAGTINAYAQPTTSPNNQKAHQNKAYQYWHIDGEYVPNQNTEHDFHTTIGVGGHDISSYAINMFTPINMNITSTTQGPTEFCLGTSHLRGHDMEIDFPVQTQNLDLLEQKDGIVETLQEFEWYVENGLYNNAVCPSELLRIPKLNQGDVVLFDYMVTHRGGSNNSNKLRSILFAMYSRKWYRDATFDTPQNNGYDTNDTNNPNEETETEIELDHLMKLTRFAIIDREKNK